MIEERNALITELSLAITLAAGRLRLFMPTSAATLKLFRQFHRWTGLFIAPTLLFFALTGAMQTLSLHEASAGSDYKPAHWIMTLAQIHKNQTDIIPARKLKSADKPAKADKPMDTSITSAPAPPPVPKWKMHLPLKVFFVLVALGLFSSTLSGIFMAYRYGGSKVVVTVLLLAGAVVPLVLLKF
jgi:FtsH-binding integral membrane protein